MKGILFTISNEKIKESLDKLQTKVESLETVKEVQDKIMETKDSQISFLDGQISTITSWISIASAIVIALTSAAFIYIKLLEKKANRKIADGEEQIRIANEKIEEADGKIQQANQIIEHANNITTIAQGKLDAIDKKQKLDIKFNNTKTNLEFLYKRQKTDHRFCIPEQKEEFNKFTDKTSELEAEYISLFSKLNNKIIRDIDITDEDIQQVEKLTVDVQKFVDDYISFYYSLRLQNAEN